ncbi:MAG: NAD(P)-dependent oxidoreductase [Candidatus Magasanikbacteria bacterium]|nr:NAD(P)-dependent oxidoreductase [Candidatus Magasanikbacteria bacterium]
MKNIAIIGCGIMGSGMAKNFLANDFKVYIWNRTKENTLSLLEKGAVWCDTPAQAVQNADIIFEVTANDESSREVWTGQNGILQTIDPAKIYIASATLSATWIDELIAQCTENNLRFCDVALTGGRVATETGQLTLLAGGDKDTIEELKNTFQAVSKKLFYFGKAGSGMRYKLILNMLQAIHIGGLGEALAIAKSQGMDMNAVGEALCDRPGGATTALAWEGYKTQAEKLNFAVNLITKDLNYAKALAQDLENPLLDDTLAKYKKAIADDKGKLDWTSIII